MRLWKLRCRDMVEKIVGNRVGWLVGVVGVVRVVRVGRVVC